MSFLQHKWPPHPTESFFKLTNDRRRADLQDPRGIPDTVAIARHVDALFFDLRQTTLVDEIELKGIEPTRCILTFVGLLAGLGQWEQRTGMSPIMTSVTRGCQDGARTSGHFVLNSLSR